MPHAYTEGQLVEQADEHEGNQSGMNEHWPVAITPPLFSMKMFRSAVGGQEQWSADGETAGTKSKRNAVAEPQTEALLHSRQIKCRS